MVLKRKILLGLLGSFLIAFQGKAQLTNQSFESYCGTDITLGGCVTFANSCVNGWYRSHGTPQLWTGGNPDGTNYLAMWNQNTSGEGVFTNSNFIKYRTYRVCMWINNNINQGEVVVRLAKNLAQRSNTTGTCGEVYPSMASTQVVYQHNLIWNSAWTKITFDFTADDDYSQFWIYPNTSSTTTASWIYIDDINLYEICSPPIVFNMTTNTYSGVIPAAFYAKKETYDAGSSAAGGSIASGTVVTPSSGDVTFEAGMLIRLLPNFRATATGSAKFRAFISPCSSDGCLAEERIVSEPRGDLSEPQRFGTAKAATENLFNNLEATSIYPNPTSGVLNITTASNSTYKLTTITGQVLKQGEIAGYSATIDLSSLPNGFYMIELTDTQNNMSSFYKVVKE